MQNIQDLNDKVFFESKNIIRILEKINTVDELISKQNLINELSERVSFLKILKDKVQYYSNSELQFSDENLSFSLNQGDTILPSFSHEVTEEEAIFNNQLNEIDENSDLSNENNAHFSNLGLEEEAIFNNQLNEIEEEEDFSDENHDLLSFVDEERILENAEPEDDEDEEIESEVSNEIQTLDNVIFEENNFNKYSENEILNIDSENSSIEEENDIEENDDLENEEDQEQYISESFSDQHDEIITENSNVENILSEIKKDIEQPREMTSEEFWGSHPDSENIEIEEKQAIISELNTDISLEDHHPENSEAYQEEKKIRLSHIKGINSTSTTSEENEKKSLNNEVEVSSSATEDANKQPQVATQQDGGEKKKPEFRLDLNDRMAFTKMLFGGSQSELNYAVFELNNCKNIEEAKEYLSDLYYAKDWGKADEYAQRLWVLVENKFL